MGERQAELLNTDTDGDTLAIKRSRDAVWKRICRRAGGELIYPPQMVLTEPVPTG